jgi:spore germination protein YaaH
MHRVRSGMSGASARAIAAGGAVLCAIALTSPATAAPAASAAAQRPRLQAFLLTSAPDSLVDLEAHARSIGVVYPTYFECDTPEGQIAGRDVPAVTRYASSRHIAVMPRINCQDGPTVHRILTDPATRAATLARLLAIARDPLYAGLCVDFENDGAEDREALSSFVGVLARALHAHRKKLSVVVDGAGAQQATPSSGLYDYGALSATVDSVFVLAWGAHWAGSTPGPIAPLSDVEATAAYIAQLPYASRFVLGAPMYGLDWPEGGGPAHPATAYQYSSVSALARSVDAAPARDPESQELTFTYSAGGVTHQVWYLDARAVRAVLAIGRAHGLAVGLWRLGREDQSLWPSP